MNTTLFFPPQVDDSIIKIGGQILKFIHENFKVLNVPTASITFNKRIINRNIECASVAEEFDLHSEFNGEDDLLSHFNSQFFNTHCKTTLNTFTIKQLISRDLVFGIQENVFAVERFKTSKKPLLTTYKEILSSIL